MLILYFAALKGTLHAPYNRYEKLMLSIFALSLVGFEAKALLCDYGGLAKHHVSNNAKFDTT